MLMREDKMIVLTYWSYNDALIQTYTLPYLRIIRNKCPRIKNITLFTLEKNKLSREEKSKIQSELAKDGIKWISGKYLPLKKGGGFLFVFHFIRLYFFILFRRNLFIHSWCTPAGSLGYLLSIFSGKKLVIDSLEPHAEAMVENGTWARKSLAFRVLFYLEKKQTKRAIACIATTQGVKKYAEEKWNAVIRNFFVKPACVDLNKFDFTGKNEKIPELRGYTVCLYAGKFGGIYLEEDVFRFYKTAWDFYSQKIRFLILSPMQKSELLHIANKYKIPPEAFYITLVPFSEIERWYAMADFAITPVKPVPTKKYCSPIKDGEYWAMGLPVIIPVNISDDSEIIEKNNIGYCWKELTESEYKKSLEKINEIISDPDHPKKIRDVAIRYRNFSVAENVYRTLFT